MKRQRILGLALIVTTLPVVALGDVSLESKKFYGYAYDLQSGAYVYTEVYDQQFENGRWLRGRTRYFSPDGKPIGEKRVDFSNDPYIPVYTLDLPAAGYSEGISKVSADGIEMFKQSRAKGRQTATLPKVPGMAADAGFDALVGANMEALRAGKTIAFKFGVAGQLDEYNFRARKIGDTQFEGRPALKLRIEPDSLLRYLIDPLILTYDPATKRLLEYRGVANIINPATGKTYNVRIVLSDKAPDDAPKNLPSLD